MKKRQDGFSSIQVLLLIIIVGLIAGIGWYVSNKANTAPRPSINTNNTKPAVEKTVSNTLESLGTTSGLFDLAKLAITQDQKDIASSILDYCISLGWQGIDSSSGRVAVGRDVFNNKDLFRSTDATASLSASCYSTILASDKQPTGRRYLLHKTITAHHWVVDNAGQQTPDCSKVDGFGYTTDVVSSCYDSNNTPRAPKQ